MVENRFPYCFACGESNPIGLHLKFAKKDLLVEAVFSPNDFHQGYPDIVHGGIVTTLLDEAMAYALEFNGYRGLTAKLYVRFLKPLRPRDNYKIMGYIDKIRNRLARVHSEIIDENGNIMARAYGLFFIDNKIGGERID